MLSICFSCNAYAEATQKDIESAIKKQTENLLQDKRFTSVSIGVVSDGKGTTGHYGELTKKQGNKPTDQTIYEVGSVSKTMVGLLTAYAIADGKLALNENVNRYIDNQLDKVSTISQPITIQQLLTHTSGLPRSFEQPGLTEETLDKSSFIKAMNKFDTSTLKGQYHYSGAGNCGGDLPVIALSHKRLFDVADSEYLAFFWIVANDGKLGTYLIHHGGMESTQNWMIIFPTHNLAISVVSNSSFPEAGQILRNVGMNIAVSLID